MNTTDVISIHKILIDRFGGSHGIRDIKGLEAALQRPYATFDQKDLYITIEEKSAALIESILINHPFIDGNKRIGYTLMRLMIMNTGKDIIATEEEKFQFVIGIAKGSLKFDSILEWINKHSKMQE